MPSPTDSPEADPPRRGLFGARTSAIAIVVASVATLAVVFVMVNSDDADAPNVQSVPAQPNTMSPRDSAPPRTEIAPPPPPPMPQQPALAMDALGFVDSEARCDPSERAAAIARTERAAVVICQAADGTYDYRATRLRDGASLQLDDVRPIAAGFEARNGGTTYRLSPTELVVISGESLQSRDAVVEYRVG